MRFAIQELGVTLAKLESRVVAGFDQLNRRIAALESRVNARFDGAETGAKKRGAEIVSRIDGVSPKFKQVRYALDELGAQRRGRDVRCADCHEPTCGVFNVPDLRSRTLERRDRHRDRSS
ncbi:hypothetical protein [Candidatus Palauibacter soopunensis]|uniref:hypothetical protein n=1 Tax=Candidatus Palauibacter soopunensis TaxID=3056739 RepID=UPI0023980B8B|nr:hypothetical protein [Candidatus Palauibacter soopunensis]MDE0072515.1 hypothetical protein [Gammaproteobacteria bacterium]MDE2878843.1 hypothetical protein [Candidatus Palauibacter soopunensis]